MKRILVIEDEDDIRSNVRDLMELNGYEVLCAENGKIGIELILSSKPDLIVCDINMPEMNGLELIKELRQYPEFYTTPFLFLTANASDDAVRTGMNLGADDYITKPYKGSELIRAVETRLKKNELMKDSLSNKVDDLIKNISMSMPGELTGTLNAIMGFSKILKGNVAEIKNEEMDGIIEHIHDSGARLMRLVDNYKYFNDLNSNIITSTDVKKIEDYSIESVIRSACGTAKSNYSKVKNITYELCPDKNIKIAEQYAYKILYEIADNAAKFSDPDKSLDVVSIASGGFYIIKIINFGRGMDKSEIQNIGSFMQFGREIFEQQGIGLGLAIVQNLLRLAGGKLQIDSNPNEYTSVRIYLPVV
ncbi:MAG: response regulator [Candidatus Kapabacteria bacterium]|nr:response regulator [Candidatus Kapabacteria bacterium]